MNASTRFRLPLPPPAKRQCGVLRSIRPVASSMLTSDPFTSRSKNNTKSLQSKSRSCQVENDQPLPLDSVVKQKLTVSRTQRSDGNTREGLSISRWSITLQLQ